MATNKHQAPEPAAAADPAPEPAAAPTPPAPPTPPAAHRHRTGPVAWVALGLAAAALLGTLVNSGILIAGAAQQPGGPPAVSGVGPGGDRWGDRLERRQERLERLGDRLRDRFDQRRQQGQQTEQGQQGSDNAPEQGGAQDGS